MQSVQTLLASAVAPIGATLDEMHIRATLERALSGRFTGARLLVLMPDHTRTLPLPLLFRLLTDILRDVKALDFMVALGTHPPLSEEALCRLVGITPEVRHTQYAHVGLLNHAWDDPRALAQLGVIERAQVQAISGAAWHESLGGDVPVRINRAALACDHILILSPVFPHEVIGFSGGAKYLFPGISGAEIINVSHWLGALLTVRRIIGVKWTPVRALIHAAAALLPTPVTVISMTVEGNSLSSLFVGDHVTAWEAAADQSAQRHITWLDQPVQRVLSAAAPMYDELWVASKAMYKLDPAVADGGEIIIYAPHLSVVSHVHGAYIYEVGYHVRDYILQHWARLKHIPLGVLAHSTHVKGDGVMRDGVEQPRIRVALATQISASDCEQLNLGYYDYRSIDPAEWQGRESEGVLYVPKAGERLYRVRAQSEAEHGATS
ncbi:MAG: lactate racemase domain-containing protein [Anaerolineae bacterium]|nr:lactate racemase domain-containing protein [Anaerolineae bacterium]